MRFFNYVSDNLFVSHNTSNRTLPFVPHTHRYWEIILVKSGDISYIVDNKIYKVGKDTLLITRPSVIHSISFNAIEPYERYRIHFDGSIIPEDLLEQIPEDLDVLDLKDSPLTNSLFEKMRFYCDAFDTQSSQVLMQNTIQELIYHILYAAKSLTQIKSMTKQTTIAKATEYINAHITDRLIIDKVAAQLFITRSHLYHLFVKHLNTTPKKYIVRKKLLLAQRDLRMGYKPIEACSRCGFSDYSTFYRDYKNFFGYPPSSESKVPLYRSVDP